MKVRVEEDYPGELEDKAQDLVTSLMGDEFLLKAAIPIPDVIRFPTEEARLKELQRNFEQTTKVISDFIESFI